MTVAGSTTAPPVAAPATARRPPVERAAAVVLAAMGLGLVGQFLYADVALGINVPIGVALLLAAGWLLGRRRRPALGDTWLAPAALAFAAFAALRADPTIVALDVAVALALCAAALATFGGREIVTRPLGGLVDGVAGALGWLVTGAIPAVGDARPQLRRGAGGLGSMTALVPILRGLAVAIPLAIVFVVLFASADAVFASVLDDVIGWKVDVDNILWRVVLAVALAWLAAGGIALAASAPSRADGSARATRSWSVGSIEIVTVLVVLNLLFAAFVVLQGAYLFGGLDTLAATGLTYAQYARRGFFELVAVVLLATAIVVGAERLARHRPPLLIGAAASLAALSGVVLVSAAQRLHLYQAAYGWTELRLYVLGTIVLLGLTLIALVAALTIDRVRWLGHVVLASGLVIGFGLSLLGPARFITEQNVARVTHPELVPANGSSGLDVWYSVSLGDDAIPSLVEVLPALDEETADYLRHDLRLRLADLRSDEALGAWQAWNVGRNAARDALEAAGAAGQLR